MRGRCRVALLISLVVVGGIVLVGCSGSNTPTPPPPGVTTIAGQVNLAGGVEGAQLLLDGQPVPGALNPDGSYRIEGVPPGEHRVAVVGSDGMTGGYVSVDVVEGEEVEAPEIAPTLGGQIVGMVTVQGEGGLSPLAGVEVTAQPAVMMIMQDDGNGGETTVYPPPQDLPSFTAFTNDAGSFLIPAVPEGEYVVTVAVADMTNNWQWVWVQAGHTAVADFELLPAVEPGVGTVRGRITGESGGSVVPLEGARVTVSTNSTWSPSGEAGVPMRSAEDNGSTEPGDPGIPDPGMIAPPYFDSFSTLTNANGEYALNVPSGYGSIDVWIDGFEGIWQEIVVQPREELVLDFELIPWTWDDDLPRPEPVG